MKETVRTDRTGRGGRDGLKWRLFLTLLEQNLDFLHNKSFTKLETKPRESKNARRVFYTLNSIQKSKLKYPKVQKGTENARRVLYILNLLQNRNHASKGSKWRRRRKPVLSEFSNRHTLLSPPTILAYCYYIHYVLYSPPCSRWPSLPGQGPAQEPFSAGCAHLKPWSQVISSKTIKGYEWYRTY